MRGWQFAPYCKSHGSGTITIGRSGPNTSIATVLTVCCDSMYVFISYIVA